VHLPLADDVHDAESARRLGRAQSVIDALPLEVQPTEFAVLVGPRRPDEAHLGSEPRGLHGLVRALAAEVAAEARRDERLAPARQPLLTDDQVVVDAPDHQDGVRRHAVLHFIVRGRPAVARAETRRS
jgi:hypothetical protein